MVTYETVPFVTERHASIADSGGRGMRLFPIR